MPVEVIVLERFRQEVPPIASEMRISCVIRDTDPPYSEEHPWTSEPFDIMIPLKEYTPEREQAEIRRVIEQYLKMRKPKILEAVGWS